MQLRCRAAGGPMPGTPDYAADIVLRTVGTNLNSTFAKPIYSDRMGNQRVAILTLL
jgi:hypothetical protein